MSSYFELPPGAAGTGSQPINASSGNIANNSAVATLTGVAGLFTYITGFVATASGATTALPVNITVTGIVGGTQTYTFTYPAGVLVGATPLVVMFPRPLRSSAAGVSIVVTLPASGGGGTNAAVNAYGFTADV